MWICPGLSCISSTGIRSTHSTHYSLPTRCIPITHSTTSRIVKSNTRYERLSTPPLHTNYIWIQPTHRLPSYFPPYGTPHPCAHAIPSTVTNVNLYQGPFLGPFIHVSLYQGGMSAASTAHIECLHEKGLLHNSAHDVLGVRRRRAWKDFIKVASIMIYDPADDHNNIRKHLRL